MCFCNAISSCIGCVLDPVEDGMTVELFLQNDEGSIVQEGSHDELAKQRGSMYAQLWQAQAQYYT